MAQALPTNQKPSTNYLNHNFQVDTDMRHFNEVEPRAPFPSKQRTIYLHMPQLAEPILLIDVDKITIGRAKGENRLDLSLQYAKMLGVSREHATIMYRDGNYYITDLGSTNGTYLNNAKLASNAPHRLQHSDQLRFGHFVAIVSFT